MTSNHYIKVKIDKDFKPGSDKLTTWWVIKSLVTWFISSLVLMLVLSVILLILNKLVPYIIFLIFLRT